MQNSTSIRTLPLYILTRKSAAYCTTTCPKNSQCTVGHFMFPPYSNRSFLLASYLSCGRRRINYTDRTIRPREGKNRRSPMLEGLLWVCASRQIVWHYKGLPAHRRTCSIGYSRSTHILIVAVLLSFVRTMGDVGLGIHVSVLEWLWGVILLLGIRYAPR